MPIFDLDLIKLNVETCEMVVFNKKRDIDNFPWWSRPIEVFRSADERKDAAECCEISANQLNNRINQLEIPGNESTEFIIRCKDYRDRYLQCSHMLRNMGLFFKK